MKASLRESFVKQLPNQLTLLRIASVPVLLVLYPLGLEGIKIFCGFLFMIAAITDWADGFIARRFQMESKLGAVLDPIADKLLTSTALLLLASQGILWVWMAGLLLGREMAINGLRLVAKDHGIDIPVSSFGKWKTCCLDVSIVCLMVDKQLFGWPFKEVGMIALWLAFGLSMYSAYIYFQSFWKKF